MNLGETLRQTDRTLYLSALFAPDDAREALFALGLYGAEIDRIVRRARDPLAAEVRLQWWRDAIRNEGFGAEAPLALVEALREAAERYGWPLDALCAVSEGRIHDLYADPFADLDAFDGYAGEVYAAPLQLAAMAIAGEVLALDERPEAIAAFAQAAGYGGVVRASVDTAFHETERLAAGRTHIPEAVWREVGVADVRAHLSAGTVPEEAAAAVMRIAAHGEAADRMMRDAMARTSPPLRAALLPALCLTPTIKALRRRPLAGRPAGPLVAQWRLWRAARAIGGG